MLKLSPITPHDPGSSLELLGVMAVMTCIIANAYTLPYDA
jgi:hypothetical protein